jgi:hypothetical protein
MLVCWNSSTDKGQATSRAVGLSPEKQGFLYQWTL